MKNTGGSIAGKVADCIQTLYPLPWKSPFLESDAKFETSWGVALQKKGGQGGLKGLQCIRRKHERCKIQLLESESKVDSQIWFEHRRTICFYKERKGILCKD